MSGFFDGGVEIIWIILIIVVLVFLFNGFIKRTRLSSGSFFTINEGGTLVAQYP